MRAPLALAALLLASPAWGGGINLPWSVGYGSPALTTAGAPSRAQTIAAQGNCSLTLGTTPTLNNVIVADCTTANNAITVNAGWTTIYNYQFGVSNTRAKAAAYHFVVGGDGTSYTPFTIGGGAGGSLTAVEIGGLTSTVWADHYAGDTRATEAGSAADLTASVSASTAFLFVAYAGQAGTTSGNVTVTNIAGLNGADFANNNTGGAGSAAGAATGKIAASGANVVASFGGTGASAQGAALDVLGFKN